MLDPNDPASVKILIRENDALEDKVQSIKRILINYRKEMLRDGVLPYGLLCSLY